MWIWFCYISGQGSFLLFYKTAVWIRSTKDTSSRILQIIILWKITWQVNIFYHSLTLGSSVLSIQIKSTFFNCYQQSLFSKSGWILSIWHFITTLLSPLEGFPVAPWQIHFFREAHTEVSVYAVHYSHVLICPKQSRAGRWGVTKDNVGCLQNIFGVPKTLV